MTKQPRTEVDIYSDPVIAIQYAMRRHKEAARELRALILHEVEAGHSQASLARKLGMTTSTLSVWVNRARAERAGNPTGQDD